MQTPMQLPIPYTPMRSARGKSKRDGQGQKSIASYAKQVVKVIRHKATSPPQTDGSVVLARWRQCALSFVSFGPAESTSQTANRSVQPCLHSSRQNVPILYNGRPFPKKIAIRPQSASLVRKCLFAPICLFTTRVVLEYSRQPSSYNY